MQLNKVDSDGRGTVLRTSMAQDFKEAISKLGKNSQGLSTMCCFHFQMERGISCVHLHKDDDWSMVQKLLLRWTDTKLDTRKHKQHGVHVCLYGISLYERLATISSGKIARVLNQVTIGSNFRGKQILSEWLTAPHLLQVQGISYWLLIFAPHYAKFHSSDILPCRLRPLLGGLTWQGLRRT